MNLQKLIGADVFRAISDESPMMLPMGSPDGKSELRQLTLLDAWAEIDAIDLGVEPA